MLFMLLMLLPFHTLDTVCEYEVQFHQRLEQERAQWNQYREAVERELGDLRRRLTEGQEEENLEDEMKKVSLSLSLFFLNLICHLLCLCLDMKRKPFSTGNLIVCVLAELFVVKLIFCAVIESQDFIVSHRNKLNAREHLTMSQIPEPAGLLARC